MKITERTMASLSKNNNFSIESVGYTEQNFIVALASQKAETSSKIVLISRDFSDISSATSVDLRLISVTTDLAIDTADSRGIQFPIDNNALLD
jgi:ribose 5-phosphate isomerase